MLFSLTVLNFTLRSFNAITPKLTLATTILVRVEIKLGRFGDRSNHSLTGQ
jgi:hypothetical protein